MIEKKLQYRKSSIVYRIAGKGKLVLLLHGFAEDGTIWDNQIGALKNNFKIIIPDLPGSGKSELIAGAFIETYAEIVKEIIDKEIKEELSVQQEFNTVAIVGHSMGGYIALAFAEKYPAYLNSLTLFHSSAFADNEEKKLVRKKAIEFIEDKGAYPFLKTSIPGLFNEATASINKNQIELLIEKSKSFTKAALVQYYEAMIARPDRTAVLTNFTKPVLFIIGEHDKAIPLQSSLQQCYLPGVSHIHILKKTAHMGMLEETGKSNTILFDFLINF